MNNKKLIVTRADSNIKELINITHPIIKKFSKDWGADFIILDHETDCKIGDGKTHYRIMKVGELLDTYDRVLVLDSDLIINKTCPNLFDVVPEDKIGTIYEDCGSRKNARRETMKQVQKEWGNIGWNSGYINTGVFMVSKKHKNIFQKYNNNYWVGFGFDDVLLGYQIVKNNHKVYQLPFQFNHMSMFSENWNGNANKFDSFIIHYAGRRNTIEQIKNDKEYIYGIN